MSRMPGPGTGTAESGIGSALRAYCRLGHGRRAAGRLPGQECCRGQRNGIAAQPQQAGERFAELPLKAAEAGIASRHKSVDLDQGIDAVSMFAERDKGTGQPELREG